MYGTLARMKVTRENAEKLKAMYRAEPMRAVPGYLSSHVLIPDAWNDEIWLAVFFEDEESYRKNADDPAQHRDYIKMRELIEDDPEWIDGTWEATEPIKGA